MGFEYSPLPIGIGWSLECFVSVEFVAVDVAAVADIVADSSPSDRTYPLIDWIEALRRSKRLEGSMVARQIVAGPRLCLECFASPPHTFRTGPWPPAEESPETVEFV